MLEWVRLVAVQNVSDILKQHTSMKNAFLLTTFYHITCSDGHKVTHGTRSGSTLYYADLSGQVFIGFGARSGTYVDQVTFMSTRISDGKFLLYGPIGGVGGEPGIIFARIQAFYGRSGSGIDQLGVKGWLFT